MTFILWILVSSTSIKGTVKAECVPTSDCASIGYSATSYDGDSINSIKCPFDTSKLFCIPCDTKYKYTCLGDNISGGTGSACGGKYVSCECSNSEWDSESGSCKGSCSDTSCSVGNILYSDRTCYKDVLSNKTVVGIVVKDNELVMSKTIQMTWASDYNDVIGLINITSNSKAQTDMNGKGNTATIVSFHESMGETTFTSAAIYCNTYTGGVDGTSGEWYLPAAGELYSYVYGNYSTLNPVVSTLNWTYFDAYFWSSSESAYSAHFFAWSVYSDSGSMDFYGKASTKSVSCFLDIS